MREWTACWIVSTVSKELVQMQLTFSDFDRYWNIQHFSVRC